MAQNPFQKATRRQTRSRTALCGPSGSGKTYTALILATELVKVYGGRIALIDTEKNSASLYSDLFDFDAVDFTPPYSPERYVEYLRSAAEHAYTVTVIDSLSHGWFAEGGVLDIVDAAATRASGNKFAGWQTGTPAQNALITAIIGHPSHIIATMRSKQEWVVEEVDGRNKPRRIGMAPVQRDGVEYEFTVVADMDLDHKLVVNKTRCAVIADAVAVKPGPAWWEKYINWLQEGIPLATEAQREQIDTLRARVKEAGEQTSAEANAWWKSRGYTIGALTVDDADTVIDTLTRLLEYDASGDGPAPGAAVPPTDPSGTEKDTTADPTAPEPPTASGTTDGPEPSDDPAAGGYGAPGGASGASEGGLPWLTPPTGRQKATCDVEVEFTVGEPGGAQTVEKLALPHRGDQPEPGTQVRFRDAEEHEYVGVVVRVYPPGEAPF